MLVDLFLFFLSFFSFSLRFFSFFRLLRDELLVELRLLSVFFFSAGLGVLFNSPLGLFSSSATSSLHLGVLCNSPLGLFSSPLASFKGDTDFFLGSAFFFAKSPSSGDLSRRAPRGG